MSKEKATYPINPKLRAAVAVDYPEASEILVSFPEKWELVGTIKRGDYDLYVGAFPREVERPRRDHFHGLSAEVNRAANTHSHHKLFQPWPQPSIIAEFDPESGVGRVAGQGYLRVQMHEDARDRRVTGVVRRKRRGDLAYEHAVGKNRTYDISR